MLHAETLGKGLGTRVIDTFKLMQASLPYHANNNCNDGWEDKIVRSYVPLQLSDKCGHLHYVNDDKEDFDGLYYSQSLVSRATAAPPTQKVGGAGVRQSLHVYACMDCSHRTHALYQSLCYTILC